MGIIWQTIIHTPWWLYLLLVYLIIVGVKASKSRIIPFWKIFVLPIIFLSISIQNVMTIENVEYVKHK